MEFEIYNKIFFRKDFKYREDLMLAVNKFVEKEKIAYAKMGQEVMITKEFYKGESILVRIFRIDEHKILRDKELERERERKRQRIREKGNRSR